MVASDFTSGVFSIGYLFAGGSRVSSGNTKLKDHANEIYNRSCHASCFGTEAKSGTLKDEVCAKPCLEI